MKSGVARALAERAAKVVDAAFMGFQLDLPLDAEGSEHARTVSDLADAVAALA